MPTAVDAILALKDSESLKISSLSPFLMIGERHEFVTECRRSKKCDAVRAFRFSDSIDKKFRMYDVETLKDAAENGQWRTVCESPKTTPSK